MDGYRMMQECPPNTSQYAVRAGDTYYSIARRFNTTIEALSAANPGVDPNSLQVGRLICVPRRGTYPACPGGAYYTVRAGDTMYAIALQFNVPLNLLLAANAGVDPNRLYVGQSLCIPGVPAQTGCPIGFTPYVVQAGDTLYAIAARYGVSLAALILANPLARARSLAVGQVLCIPGV